MLGELSTMASGVCEIGSPGLELIIQTRMSSSSWPPCLLFPRAGQIGTCVYPVPAVSLLNGCLLYLINSGLEAVAFPICQ